MEHQIDFEFGEDALEKTRVGIEPVNSRSRAEPVRLQGEMAMVQGPRSRRRVISRADLAGGQPVTRTVEARIRSRYPDAVESRA